MSNARALHPWAVIYTSEDGFSKFVRRDSVTGEIILRVASYPYTSVNVTTTLWSCRGRWENLQLIKSDVIPIPRKFKESGHHSYQEAKYVVDQWALREGWVFLSEEPSISLRQGVS